LALGRERRWELDRALRAAELRGDLLEAHASLLGAQVSLCNADFGGMSVGWRRPGFVGELARGSATPA